MSYKAMYKCELANAAGVSRQTFYNWTKEYQDDLRQFGFPETQSYSRLKPFSFFVRSI